MSSQIRKSGGSSGKPSSSIMTSSFRSTTTAESDEGSLSAASYAIKNLHGKLVRSHKRRDPYRFYDVIKVLGDGSMGSVTLVKRKHHYKGGSARVKFVQENDRETCCFGFLSWVPCPVPKNAFQSMSGGESGRSSGRTISESTSNDTQDSQDRRRGYYGSPTQQTTIPEEDCQPAGDKTSEGQERNGSSFRNNSNDGSGQRRGGHPELRHSASSMITYGTQKEYRYALKSIHMDRVNDIFIKELMNEIAILQALDHPNIVKAIETFEFNKQVYLVLELCNGGDLYSRGVSHVW